MVADENERSGRRDIKHFSRGELCLDGAELEGAREEVSKIEGLGFHFTIDLLKLAATRQALERIDDRTFAPVVPGLHVAQARVLAYVGSGG